MERAYQMVEVVGVSDESYAQATRNAVSAASKKQPGLSWFEVVEQRGRIDNGEVVEFQVKIRIGFRVV
ncbi:MAG: dodecin family protein [Candidatus Hydrogenedentota bacterium]